MKEQDLQDMANKVAAEFQTESNVEALTKARILKVNYLGRSASISLAE
ncbi:MAG: hypothetical protein ACNYPE_09135 [Candidatus Azotimanducaceae bacterium WSBS_2022_MAG_OTU7]